MEKIFKKSTTSKETTFERLERTRYEKLRNSPKQSGKTYPDLNLDGCTQKEILSGF